MTRKEFREGLEATFKGCLAIVDKKNADYADDGDPFKNFNAANLLAGVDPKVAIMVRLSDKMMRIGHGLHRELQVKDEKLVDTIDDSINYLAILKELMKDEAARANTKL